jgi:hypothetical protein
MQFDLTIAGVAKQLKAGSLNIHLQANGRATASFRIDSVDRSYRPAIDAEVIMEEDGTRIFGGLIDRPAERALAGPIRPGISTTVNAVDYNAYTERRFVNETLAAGTLKSQLQTLVTNYLAVFGVSLHASQVNGPNLPDLTYDYVRLDEVLNELVTLTADVGQPYVWSIDHTKVLRAYQPSTVSAPFNLVGNDLPEVVGDIEVEPSNDGTANKVIIRVAPKTEAGRIETFTGDGTQGPFQLTYTPTKLYGHILLGSGPPFNNGGETLGFPGDGGQWSYDSSTNSITRDAGITVVGELYNLYFDGVFNGSWTATDASWTTNPKEKVIVLESIPDDTTGQAFADAELAKSLTGPIFVTYHTWQQGVEPGQEQSIDVSARNVNGATAVITQVVIRDLVHRLDREVTAVVDDAQTNLDRGWGDVYRIWAGDKTGAGVSATVGTGGVSSGGPAPPFQSVQFNDSGAFGGDDAFIYYKNENSVVCGGNGSSITAASFESCQVLGSNCHIA